MYSKLDIFEIFKNCKNLDEFVTVSEAFLWAIDNHFMVGDDFLHKVSKYMLDKLI